MTTLFIQPQQSLIEEIIPHLKVASRDYSSNLVVFPGRRPSHFLRKAIAKKVKGSFIPPAIFSIDEFKGFTLTCPLATGMLTLRRFSLCLRTGAAFAPSRLIHRKRF